MKIKVTVIILIALIVTLFLSMASYGINIDEAILQSKNKYEESFTQYDGIEHNYESDQVSLFLPNGLKVVEETEYNLIIEDKGQVYILFFNPYERENSRVHYDLDSEYKDEALLFETYETDDLFSYFFVLKEDKELNAVICIGGAKISTLTKTSQLPTSTEKMLQILHSLTYRN